MVKCCDSCRFVFDCRLINREECARYVPYWIAEHRSAWYRSLPVDVRERYDAEHAPIKGVS